MYTDKHGFLYLCASFLSVVKYAIAKVRVYTNHFHFNPTPTVVCVLTDHLSDQNKGIR